MDTLMAWFRAQDSNLRRVSPLDYKTSAVGRLANPENKAPAMGLGAAWSRDRDSNPGILPTKEASYRLTITAKTRFWQASRQDEPIDASLLNILTFRAYLFHCFCFLK